MTSLKYLYLFLLLSVLPLASFGQQNNNLNTPPIFKKKHDKFLGKLETKAKRIFSEKELFGDFLFAIVNENGLAYSFILNRDILAGKTSALNNDTPIYIASHTKSFTGTLLKILEEQGKVDLNHAIIDYLPELHFNDSIDTKNISLKSCLSHTHGILSNLLTWKTAYLGYSGSNTELTNDLNHYSRYDTSHKFRYSNVGPIIAAMVAEKVTGNTWKEDIKSLIFNPLKMNHTSANVSDFDFKTIRPSVTVSGTTGILEKGFYKNDNTMHASGGIISTINDLSKWLKANINRNETLLAQSSWPELHEAITSQNRKFFTYKRTGFSLGWDVAEYQNRTLLTRFGGLAGISFHMSFMPQQNIGIIACSTDNRASSIPHLFANYVYNECIGLDSNHIFETELKTFNTTFNKKNSKTYPARTNLLQVNTTNNAITGTYKNTTGWPDIKIIKAQGYYQLKWGVLRGKIYKTNQDEYLACLGVMNRPFRIDNDSLVSGSLVYSKE